MDNPEYEFEESVDKPAAFNRLSYLFKKKFLFLLIFFVLTIALALFYMRRAPKQYETYAQVMLERPLPPVGKTVEAPETSQEEYYEKEMATMKSDDVLLPVVESQRLVDYFGVKTEEEAMARVRDMLSVERSGTSRLFNLKITAFEPQLAAHLANAVARAYIRKTFETSLYYSQGILNWLPEEGKTADTMTIQDPEGAPLKVRREDLMETLPALRGDPTLRQLRQKKSELEAEVERTSLQYGEKHPLLIKARANLQFLNDSIEDEKKRIIEELKVKAAQDHRFGNARLIEEAKIPKVPVAESLYFRVAVIGFIELILSFIIILLADYFDPTIRNVEDLERKGVAIPYLGHIPFIKLKRKTDKKQPAQNHQNHPVLGDAFRYIRVAINFSGSSEAIKLLAFSSCLPHEGKSFVAHHIALSLALDGNRTLLVDADLRRPAVHKQFSLPNTVGLSDYLTGPSELSPLLQESGVENLTILTSGRLNPNPLRLLESPRMQQFLEEARQRFDRIIMDCPPLTGIGDGYAIGACVGQITLVIAAGQTPADLIKQNLKQLEKSHIKVLGAILNRVDVERNPLSAHYRPQIQPRDPRRPY